MDHGAAGRQGADRGHAGPDQVGPGGARGLSRRGARHEPARGRRPELLLRRFAHPVRRVAAGGAQRGGGAARPQRRGQEHHAQEPDGRGDAAQRQGRVRRQERRRPEEPRDRPRRHAAGPRGSPHLRQPQRRGEPGAGRPERAQALADRAHLGDVPAAEGAPRQPRHRPVGRRAADAGDRPRADPRPASWSCSTSRSRAWRR